VSNVDPVLHLLADLDQPARPTVEFKEALLDRLLAELRPAAEPRPREGRPWRVRLVPDAPWRLRGRRRVLVLAVAVLIVVVGAASAFGVRALLTDKGIVGLAPDGATPSTPRQGELVLDYAYGHTLGDAGRFNLSMYADGRLIWQRIGDYSRADERRDSSGLLERRLTPEGVELVKAEVISSGLVDHDLHLRSGEGLYFGRIEVRDGDRFVHVTWGDIGTPYTDVPG
jgi:hypothetical protein